jgi:hypothetical protein
MWNELHALFVYADSFWDNLRALRQSLPGLAPLGVLCDSNVAAALTAKNARDHVEHFAERITDGRPERRNAPAMAPEVFRRGAGGFDGLRMYFGDEWFDVVEIHDAVMAAQSEALEILGGCM